MLFYWPKYVIFVHFDLRCLSTVRLNIYLTFQKLDNAIAELLDTSEPLIHNSFGYGSQGLINLMLTGQAVPHVWDHDKDVGGLSKFLRGDLFKIFSNLTRLTIHESAKIAKNWQKNVAKIPKINESFQN